MSALDRRALRPSPLGDAAAPPRRHCAAFGLLLLAALVGSGGCLAYDPSAEPDESDGAADLELAEDFPSDWPAEPVARPWAEDGSPSEPRSDEPSDQPPTRGIAEPPVEAEQLESASLRADPSPDPWR